MAASRRNSDFAAATARIRWFLLRARAMPGAEQTRRALHRYAHATSLRHRRAQDQLLSDAVL